MRNRKLWNHQPNFDWIYPDGEPGTMTAAKLLTERVCVCQICGVDIRDHDAVWPKRPRWVFVFELGFGRMPEENAMYPRAVALRVGFGPGLWALAGRRRPKLWGWRRIL